MAEKKIRLPKWNGEEYYPATTTEAVADRERQKGLNEVLSDIEDTIDSYNRANQLMLNQKQDKLSYYTENTSTDTAVIKVTHDTDEATLHEDKVEVGVDNCVLLKSEDLLLGEDSYIKVSPEKVSMSSSQGKIGDVVDALVSNANAIDVLNGEGEGSVSKKVTDKIAEIVAGAPADLDTLKKIADYIASDKTNAADINNTLTALKTRVYELGDFPTSGDAENAAKNPKISGNEAISIIHYTVNGTTDGLILQHQDIDNVYYRSLQTLFYHSRVYVRFVWFTDSTRTVLLENANFNRDWWETSISHLEYDKTTHTIKCRRIGQDVNSTKWITLPSASTSTDGLMTMAQVKSLEGKQDQLDNYVEIPRGKTTIKYPNGTARVEVSNVRAALWANDDKVAIAADANGTRMLYTKTAEDGYIEHRDEISIGRHNDSSATHITLLSKSTTEEAGEKTTSTSTIQVNPDGISMTSPNGEIDDVVKEIAAHQNDAIVELTNGNLKLTLKGETREFMPATPSGDPMHYAYVSAGAEYNATDDFILKDAPWKDMVDTIEDKAKWSLDVVDASNVHQMTINGVEYNYATENRTSPEGGTYLRYFIVGKGSNGVWVEDETKVLHLPKCWYLNGLGDITNAEMRSIYAVKHMSYAPGGGFAGTPCRTFIDRIKHTGSDLSYGDRYHRCKIVESIYSNVHRVVNAGFNYAITSTTALRYFLPAVTLVSYTNKIYGTFGDDSLRVLYIAGAQTAIRFPSKYISKASILYTINNVAPTLTSAITITLHHDAYERLKGDADILQALTTKNADLANTGDGKGKVSLVCATDNDTIPTE